MKNFKRIRFYCGIGFDADGQPVDPGAVEKVKEHVTTGFGGATFTKGEGTWRDRVTRQIVSEPALVVEVLADPEMTSNEFIDFTADTLRIILKQSSVLYTIEPGILGDFV